MAEIIKPDSFTPRQISKDEIARQFLEDSIQTLGYHLRKACDEKDQFAIEIIFEMLSKIRRMLRDIQNVPVTHWRSLALDLPYTPANKKPRSKPEPVKKLSECNWELIKFCCVNTKPAG
mgnify:CR=1 FL=1